MDASWRRFDDALDHWGEGRALELFVPSLARGGRLQRRLVSTFERAAASPAMARALIDGGVDVRDILSSVAVPTLVLHRTGDLVAPIAGGRWLAEHIPGARFVELQGNDHFPVVGDTAAVLAEIEGFLTGSRHQAARGDRSLATVLFTDIVGSTDRASSLGDSGWRSVIDQHNQLVRAELDRFRGVERKTTGDGFLATFDGPARAIDCARAIVEAVGELGIEVRAGLHTGEVDIVEGDVLGLAVSIAARVESLASRSEVLVSQTVRDLVVGSGYVFEPRGTEVLKGVPGEWRLFAVAPAPAVAVPVSSTRTLSAGDRALMAMNRRAPRLSQRLTAALLRNR